MQPKRRFQRSVCLYFSDYVIFSYFSSFFFGQDLRIIFCFPTPRKIENRINSCVIVLYIFSIIILRGVCFSYFLLVICFYLLQFLWGITLLGQYFHICLVCKENIFSFITLMILVGYYLRQKKRKENLS